MQNQKKTIIHRCGLFALTSEMIDTKLFREADNQLVGYKPDDIVSAVKTANYIKFIQTTSQM